MKKAAFVIALALVLFVGHRTVVLSHCEIPCGIYGDTTRIDLLLEDISTVEKSMAQMRTLAEQEPINVNQIIRWTMNKEEHANKIQHIVTQYFMTQRVKPKTPADGAAYEKYVAQLTTLHGMLVHAMKAKQTTDQAHVEKLRELVVQFSKLYFNDDDLKHIRSHHPEGK